MFLSLVFVKYQRDHVQLSGTGFLLFDFHFDLKVKDVGLKPMKIVFVGFVHFLVWKICLKQYYLGGGIGIGKTCEPKAFSFQCMTKFTTKNK